MGKEPFMLVSLKEGKAKKLAQVMSSPTCIKLLEYLSGKDATETQIAAEMKIPLSTVHYNIQQLVEAKLVVADEFHYSEKGREVQHYKLANKYIIIAPQEEDPNLLERLKKFVPITIITLGLAVVLKTMQFMTGSLATQSAATNTFEATPLVAPVAAPMAKSVVAPLADQAAEQAVGGALPAAAPGLMRAMAPDAINTSLNETLNESANESANAGGTFLAGTPLNETVNASAYAAAGSPTGPSTAPYIAPHIPWWQSPMIDYFLLGAFFVIVVFVIAETIAYLRSKRGDD
jgi:hypothetical protein